MELADLELLNARYFQQAQWTKDIRSYLMPFLGIREGSDVLDVGCGTGAMAGEFGQAGWHGIDIDLSVLRFGKQKQGLSKLINADGFDLPFEDDRFDLVLAHYLLLWIDHPLDLIREMKRVSKPNGAITFFAEPDHAGRIGFPHENELIGGLQTDALVEKGIDPMIGRKLGSLLVEAGVRDVHFGLIGGEWSDAAKRDVLEEKILMEDLGSTGQIAQDQEIKRNGGGFIYVPTFYAFGYK